MLPLAHASLADEAAERPAGRQPLDVDAIRDEAALRLPLRVVLLGELREAPIDADVDLLAARQLELRAAQRLLRGGRELLVRADGDQHGADVDARNGAVRLTVGAAHTRLQTIRTGARKHLVDTQHVEGGTRMRMW